MTLQQLWKRVDKLHDEHYPGHALRPIHGAGKASRPRIMFVFINPTARNVSTSKSWKGPRYPFIGTKQVWRIFHRAGFIDDRLMARIEGGAWDGELTEDVAAFLERKGIYITNIVKWAGHDAALPDREKIALFLPLLQEEIAIVQPRRIIAFGLIPFEALTGEKITLGAYYEEAMRRKTLRAFPTGKTEVIPCYFPIGRGNPKRAVQLLQLVR